ncbi:hypothetical protein EVAR_50021_1 [Eumeta japonica]|uniref:Uncharacterized protein n=1 Tax=Eumeta variegata TaxID=151549 RepID=A0A4C1YSE7_EUMVA|nr:hypothetical protein EVAR_50021_1 [Eumeta japonica]
MDLSFPQIRTCKAYLNIYTFPTAYYNNKSYETRRLQEKETPLHLARPATHRSEEINGTGESQTCASGSREKLSISPRAPSATINLSRSNQSRPSVERTSGNLFPHDL